MSKINMIDGGGQVDWKEVMNGYICNGEEEVLKKETDLRMF